MGAPSSLVPDMEHQEHETGTVRVSGGTSDGAGRRAAAAGAAVRANRPDAPQAADRVLPAEPAASEETAAAPPPSDPLSPAPPPPSDPLSPDPSLLRLAHWFAAADPETAHDLAAASFGLYPARHFGSATERPAPGAAAADTRDGGGDEDGAQAEVSWWHGPTAFDPAALRTREARPARGGLRRARRGATDRPGTAQPETAAGAARPGRHRKPERSRPGAAEQDRSAPAGDTAERRIAARLLLAHPLVTAAGPHADGFPLIRRHRDWLVERFATLLGYRLVVGPWHARLCKAGPGPGSGRRLAHPGTGVPLTPGGYAQLALALALLVDAPEQLPTAGLLAGLRGIEASAADRAAALAVLADWQVLTGPAADAGDGRPPADQPPADPSPGRPAGDALLTVDRELARAVPAGPPALAAADAADLVRRAAATDPATAVRRRLAETPAVLADDLTDEQRDWLHHHRHSGPAAVAGFLGLEAELRAEGVALLDPADELTDLALPGTGTLAQAALLLVERLVEELRPLPGEEPGPYRGGAVPVPDALIDGVLGDIADEYGLPAGWRRDYLADRTALRRDVLDLLHRMSLLRRAPLGDRPPTWLLRAPAARFAPAAELTPAPGSGRHGRRDQVTVPAPPGPAAELRA